MNFSLQTLVGCTLAAVIATTVAPPSAHAETRTAIYQAADRYRDAVSHFEDEARRVRSIDRGVLRLVDDLEDQTSDVRSAARRLDRPDRLLQEFNQVQFLQAQTEQAVFGSGCPIIAAALTPCWSEVLSSYALLQQQISFIQPYVAARPASGCGVGHSQTFFSPSIQSNRFPSSPFQASPFQASPFQASPFQQGPSLFPGHVPAPLPQSSGFGQPFGSNFRGPIASPIKVAPRPGNYRAAISNRPSVPANNPIGLMLLNSLLNR